MAAKVSQPSDGTTISGLVEQIEAKAAEFSAKMGTDNDQELYEDFVEAVHELLDVKCEPGEKLDLDEESKETFRNMRENVKKNLDIIKEGSKAKGKK